MNIYGTIQMYELIIHQYYLKNYYNAGFTFTIDLFDNNVNLISLDIIKDFKIKSNFNEYAGLKNTIITNLYNKDIRNNYEPIVPNTILLFYKNT